MSGARDGNAFACDRQIYRAVFWAIISVVLDDELIFRTPCRRIGGGVIVW